MWFTFGEILSNIVKTMKTGKNASFRNVVERHRSVTLFSFLDVQIAWLQTVGRDGTAQNYQRARNSFSLYRCGRDIPLRSVTSELICDYESWLMFFVRAIRFRLIFGEVPFFRRNGYAQRDVFGFSVLCHPEHQRVIAIIQDFRLVTDDFYCCIHGNFWFKHRFKQTSENAPKIKHKKSSQISLTA